jgi:uncharacterized membrane protein YdbT with pleckstrin-like domain
MTTRGEEMGTGAPESTVWQGTPAVLADLPSYVALVLGALVLTVGFVALGNAMPEPAVGERDPARIVPWVIAAVWVGCALAALAFYARSRSTRYLLTTQRLRITTGLLSTTTEDIELRRVRDTSVVRPFLLRLLGLGHVVLVSADPSSPRVELRAVRDPDARQSQIRELVQGLYLRHGVREIDVM